MIYLSYTLLLLVVILPLPLQKIPSHHKGASSTILFTKQQQQLTTLQDYNRLLPLWLLQTEGKNSIFNFDNDNEVKQSHRCSSLASSLLLSCRCRRLRQETRMTTASFGNVEMIKKCRFFIHVWVTGKGGMRTGYHMRVLSLRMFFFFFQFSIHVQFLFIDDNDYLTISSDSN